MLFQKCRAGQATRIGNDVKVTIIEVKARRVRIGIQAPRDLSGYRQELWVQFRPAPGIGREPAGTARG